MRRLLRAALARVRGDDAGETGSAIIEFVFVAVVVMVPLVYLIAAVATVQRTELASTQAARNAGRAFATSDTARDANRRARAAVDLAMQSQGLSGHVDLHFVASGRSCDNRNARITPQLTPGSEFTVCVVRTVQLPGVPSVLSGRGVRTIGVYVVHVDDFREVDR